MSLHGIVPRPVSSRPNLRAQSSLTLCLMSCAKRQKARSKTFPRDAWCLLCRRVFQNHWSLLEGPHNEGQFIWHQWVPLPDIPERTSSHGRAILHCGTVALLVCQVAIQTLLGTLGVLQVQASSRDLVQVLICSKSVFGVSWKPCS